MKSNKILRLMGALSLLLLSVACRAAPQRESKPSADWSRGVAVGQYVNGSIGMTVDDAGERVHLAWPFNLGEGTRIRYLQLDSQASPILSKELEFPGLLRAPRLVPATPGRLHLFWASRPPGGKFWTIWHVLLDESGNTVTPITQVSLSGINVGGYVVASDQNGGALVSWGSGSRGDIYLQHLDQAGSMGREPLVITTNGEAPSIWVTPSGDLYYAWRGDRGFVYATSTLQLLSPQDVVDVIDVVMGTGQSYVGPYVGVTGGWAYLFWSTLNQSGLEAGTGYTAYVAFPADAPAKTVPTRIAMLPVEEQPYVAYQGSFSLTQLVPPVEEAWASSDYILNPSVMQGEQSDELAVAIALNQQLRLDAHLQIAVALFKDGQFRGYTLGTKTEGISDDPVLFNDASNQLHLAWREGAAGRKVFYASTQPETIAALDRLNAGDITNAVLQGGVESLVSVALLPVIGFGWLLPGMLVVGVWKLFRDEDNLTAWVNWLPLCIALLLFNLVKFTTLPTLTTYVPFSAWLDIPGWLGGPLRIAVPVLIFGLAALVGNRVRKRYSQSAALFYVVFALVDALLSLAIYGVNFLGVY